MDYKQYIQNLKDEWIGKTVSFEGSSYTVVDVDYNGGLAINKKAEYTDTTIVGIWQLDKEDVNGK